MTNPDLISVGTPSISVNVRRQAVVLSILVLAVALRIYAISLYPLTGDEYNSLAEAKSVGLNWNSIIYSGLMHFWIRLGTSELWLRLPAAIFGTATVGIIFKLGDKLEGWRTGVVGGLLAATSPFSIYHSQEVRFYAFFIFMTGAFMLATVHYIDARPTWRQRAVLLLTAVTLFFSHFLGPLALYVQSAAAVAAGKSKSRKRILLILVGLAVIVCGLLLTPGLHHQLWRLYQIYGNAPSSSEPLMTSVSIMNLVKAAFAGFVFAFGYHVYPFRLVFVVVGILVSGFLLAAGAIRLWQGKRWRILPFAYLLALGVVYVVLDAAGGRLASGVSPRHVAFVWPMFLLLMAIGVTSFEKPVLYIVAAAVLALNAFSIGSGWQKDWAYGISSDPREAAAYASKWVTKDTAVIHDGRSKGEIDFYFPKGAPLVDSSPYIQNRDLISQLPYQRLIFFTDDWELENRRDAEKLMRGLSNQYACIDGHVDYPLFEYVFERKTSSEGAGYDLRSETNQVQQPLSDYGLEFQDLHLPVSVKVKDVPLMVIGAYGLPDLDGRSELSIPLAHAANAKRIILLSDVVGADGLEPDQQIAELSLENTANKSLTFPLRLGSETASWSQQCERPAPCTTVFQWHKRLAIVGQNRYEGALYDFPAGLHGVVLDLPAAQKVVGLTIRYTASSGRLYVWGLALAET